MVLKQLQGFNIHTGITDLGSSISVQEITDLERITPGPSGVIDVYASLANLKKVDCVGLTAQAIQSSTAQITDITAKTIEADTAQITDITAKTIVADTANIADITAKTIVANTADIADITAKTIEADTANIADIIAQTVKSVSADIATLNANIAQMTEATITTLHSTAIDCVTLASVNISALIATFGSLTVSTNMNIVGNLTVTGGARVAGSLSAGNIISQTMVIVADAMGFYVWTHALLLPPVAYFASAEGGEIIRLISTTNASARFFLYADGPIRVHFLAIGV
jgi:hypothetical protein